MDSVQSMTMVGDIEAKLGVRLSPTLAWDYPDINALSAHFAGRSGDSSPRGRARAAPASAPLAPDRDAAQ